MEKRDEHDSSYKASEHKLYYEIYYNELNLFYKKTTIFTTVQLALFSGVLLEYESLSKKPLIMIASPFFLLPFSLMQFLIAIRGYGVNNAVITTIQEFEKNECFDFLNTFQKEVAKRHVVKKMNFPSYAIIITSALFLVVWFIVFIAFTLQYWAQIVSLLSIVMVKVSGAFSSLSAIMRIILSAAFGLFLAITMKIADMLDEHGLKMFSHANIVFGVAWGICGTVLVLISNELANAMMAMMIGYVIRLRLDYKNHIIAFVLIIISFIIWGSIEKIILIALSVSFTALGIVKDFKYLNKEGKVYKYVKKFYQYVPVIYSLPCFVYAIITGKWEVFVALFCFDFGYNIVRLIAKRQTWYTEVEAEKIEV